MCIFSMYYANYVATREDGLLHESACGPVPMTLVKNNFYSRYSSKTMMSSATNTLR